MKVKINKEEFDIALCKSVLSKALGLMFRFPKNDGLLFLFNRGKKVSLHMVFVFFPIDIIYFNEEKEVIKVLKNVKPFVPYIKSVECKYILEVKDCKNIKLNDKLYI